MKKRYIFLTIFIILISIYFARNNIIVDSKNSVDIVCNPEIANESNIIVIGKTVSFPNGTIEITYFEDPRQIKQNLTGPSLTTIKHENCHKRQSERPIWLSNQCNHQFQKFLREFECHISQDFPMTIYEILYQKL